MASGPDRSWLPTSGRGRYVLGAGLLLVAATIAGIIEVTRPADVQAYALVSGRDDHGVAVATSRELHASPDGDVSDTISVGTLVAITDEQTPWLYVATVEGPALEGWIDDFVLRGTVHVVLPDTPACPPTVANMVLEPSAQVRIVDHHDTPDGPEVGIRLVTTQREYHVPRDWLQDWPGPAGTAATDCRNVADLGEPVHDH